MDKKKKKLELLHCISCNHYFREDFYQEGFGVEFQDFTEVNVFSENFSEVLAFYLEHLPKVKGPVGMHGAFIDLKPYSYDRYISDASMVKYRMSMNMACLCQVDYIVFHSQLNPFIHNPLLLSLDNETHGKLFLNLMEEFHNFKGTVCIENVYETDPHMLRELMDAIDHPRVKVNLDVGHANLSKNFDLGDWIDVLGVENIAYCHFQYNDGSKDTHSPPTVKEIMEILKIFERKEVHVPLSLEYFPEDMYEERRRFQEAIERGGLDFAL